MKIRKANQENMKKVIYNLNEGLSISEICRKLVISRTEVINLIRLYKAGVNNFDSFNKKIYEEYKNTKDLDFICKKYFFSVNDIEKIINKMDFENKQKKYDSNFNKDEKLFYTNLRVDNYPCVTKFVIPLEVDSKRIHVRNKMTANEFKKQYNKYKIIKIYIYKESSVSNIWLEAL